MDKILTKKIQIQISDYFSTTTTSLSKPEVRSMKDMVLGILKSKSVFVNQIKTVARHCEISVDFVSYFYGIITPRHLKKHFHKIDKH